MSTVDIFPSVEELESCVSVDCDRCGKVFANTQAKQLHLVKTHGVIASEREMRYVDPRVIRPPSPTRRFFCPHEICGSKGKRFAQLRLLRQHWQKQHSEKDKRCSCGKAFALVRDLTYHQRARCSLITRDETTRQKKKKETKQCAIITQAGCSRKVVVVSTSDVSSLVDDIFPSTSRAHSISTQTDAVLEPVESFARPFIPSLLQDSTCQTLAPYGGYEMRHVETSMEGEAMDEYLRDIETQTLPPWDGVSSLEQYY